MDRRTGACARPASALGGSGTDTAVTRIAWSKRLVKLLAVTVLVIATCISLGIWQIARLHQKQQFNAAVTAGLSRSPAPVSTLLPAGVDPDAVRYRRVEATGTYDVAHEVVLYGRTQDDQAGNHLLTPLELDDGGAILVDRGWVPLEIDEPGSAPAAPPTGEVTIEGVLFASEGDAPGPVGTASSPSTTMARVDLARIQAQLPYRIEPVYLLLQEQTPAQTGGLPAPSPLPELSEGPHLSYAIQWFTFAAIALVGFVVLARREDDEGSKTDREQVG
jgi:surfeit locus 1 family protein